MNLSQLSVKKPVTTAMCVLIVIILGIVSVSKLPIDLFPEIEIPVAIVSTSYPNVGPEEIEKLITRPIEEAVGTVENIDLIQSITSEGSSLVAVSFKYGTDMDFTTLKMREKVDLIKGFLPEDASSPMVLQIDLNSQPIIQIALTGSDIASLYEYSDSVLKPGLEKIKGVASVSIGGGYENYISVKIHNDRLNGYGLTVDGIAQILAAENMNLPAGSVNNGEKELLIRTVGEFQSIEEVGRVPITLPSGGLIHLNDIAEITLANKDLESISKVNGEQAVSLSIQKQSGTNTVEVADKVLEAIKSYDESSPYSIKVIVDTSLFIKDSVSQVASTGLVGGFLAIIILFIFLRNIKSTIIIGLSIPISIISTFILMYFSGITLNMMTLGGLALGIGMLVDNSVVVLENIYRFAQDGYEKREAAIEGSKEVGLAVSASTLTTIAVFLPIVFVEGLSSMIFQDLALTITFSLISSLVVSLTLIPMMASKILSIEVLLGKHQEGRFQIFGKLFDKSDQLYASIEEGYKKLLVWALKHRKFIAITSIITFVASLLSIGLIGMEFMPVADEGAFTVQLELESGSKTADTSMAIDEVVNKIIDIEDIEYLFSTTQGNNFTVASQNVGTIYGTLKPLGVRTLSTNDVILEVDRRVADIPGVKINVAAQSSTSMTMGSPISINIKGNDLKVLEDLSEQVIFATKSVEGTRNVRNNTSDPIPQVEISLNRDTASRFGLTTYQVSNAVKNVIDGKTATRYKLEGEEIDVIIEGDDRYEKSIENLKQLTISTPTGASVPLELVAAVNINTGPVVINRDNQSRMITVSSDLQNRDLASVSRDIQGKINELIIPDGYSIELSGQNEEMMESFSDLILALVLAVLLVYMIMAAQFESLLIPFIIMFSVPLAYSGALFGLLFTNRTINVVSLIGFIMLAGIVVNNAIVLIDYIQTRRSFGEEREEAILKAGPIRLRPILMTTLTTTLGLLPLALEIGEGAELQSPMATVVIAGLTLSTVLTLIFIPVIYSYFDDKHMNFINRKTRRLEKGLKKNETS